MTAKSRRFNNVLLSAKKALDKVGIPFHLHYGTALGAHREKDFIKHDHDIDLAIFAEDVNTQSKFRKLKESMMSEGFNFASSLGSLQRGKEVAFEKNDIPLDIFWVYSGKYKGKNYAIISTYYGICDELPGKECVYGYRPYKTIPIMLHGVEYQSVPLKTVVDMYGSDWKKPKKYSYFEAQLEGHDKGLIVDYYEPLRKIDTKIAFCFLTYSGIKHQKIWENFFIQDMYPNKSYTIYSHIKKVTEKTPKWLKQRKIKTIPTGWCEESLVWAWINMLREALKDKNNKYFCLISGEDIPLFGFWEVYKKITSSNKSRVHLEPDSQPMQATGLMYASQWVILNRKHAKELVNLRDTKEGREFVNLMNDARCVFTDDDETCFCPDELYPINWFILLYGGISSPLFKQNFSRKTPTYTFWDGKQPHPIKFNRPNVNKMKHEICQSGAVFGRKFHATAAEVLAMKCSDIERE